ncbi:Zn-dependent exopeptidase [Lyophyllum atratum]|nr:Zn-dependent exopeptidase [Lyophyllum atratum]
MKLSSSLSLLLLASSASCAAIPLAELRSASTDGLRLLSLKDGAEPVWRTENDRLDLLRSGIQFFDVTDVYDPKAASRIANLKSAPIKYPSPTHVSEITAILRNVSIPNMERYLSNLTSFNNRYYKSSTGVAATEWIAKSMKDIASSYPASNASVSIFNHTFGPQGSIIAQIPGTTAGPVTILGAHMDSINLNDPMNGHAPGADDDGSGSINLMESFRALLEASFKPKTPVEFHWYAAEEVGLLGSQAIAKAYRAAGKEVKGMLNLDMTAYIKPGTDQVIAIMPDFIDEGLNDFLKSLIETYSSLPWVMSPKCGYACSDHASWNKQGYPSAYPSETRFGDDNLSIHMANDTTITPGWSWNHTLEFTKLAVAFAYELAI